MSSIKYASSKNLIYTSINYIGISPPPPPSFWLGEGLVVFIKYLILVLKFDEFKFVPYNNSVLVEPSDYSNK